MIIIHNTKLWLYHTIHIIRINIVSCSGMVKYPYPELHPHLCLSARLVQEGHSSLVKIWCQRMFIGYYIEYDIYIYIYVYIT